ncbi:hypothetical protein PHYPO_G00170570 [Pangasianodon hypophthalmus]|uniref:XK-related protein n=1 Tax=Pangasianodon hypophthalmus TaxID=310915 RepID=A0A5N5JEU1_PANHP|nr:hypothetical protein PHYPO_G00170570 [Pangasianodon hypophthalmus]
MLRLFEAFSESAPQLVLMMALIMEMQEMQSFTVIKIVGSLSSLSFTVLSYHRSMRAFVPEKLQDGMVFLYNLLPVEPFPDWPTCRVCIPLCLRPALLHRRSLPVPVDAAGPLVLVAEDRLHGH